MFVCIKYARKMENICEGRCIGKVYRGEGILMDIEYDGIIYEI